MKLLIFGGTSEAHTLSDNLTERGIPHTLSVATGYGEQVLKGKSPLRKVLTGRMDEEAIIDLIIREDYDFLIDATHPYAAEITKNIAAAVKKVKGLSGRGNLRAVRLVRGGGESIRERLNAYEKAYIYEDICQAAEALKGTSGNILLTTGSKELKSFISVFGTDDLRRLYVRVIPGVESIRACEEAGIETSHIIAMQGPFSRDLNEAMIHEYDIRHLVTKDSGTAGGTENKTEAAIACGISIHMISRPADNTDMELAGYEEVLQMVTDAAEGNGSARESATETAASHIDLIGMGMGNRDCITGEAIRIIGEADVIIGSERLTDICKKEYNSRAEYLISYKASEIAGFIEERLKRQDIREQGTAVALVFSGDSGFFSGCRRVYEALQRKVEGGLKAEIRIHPGISSVSYLSARIGRSYAGAYITTIHGRGEDSIIKAAAHVRICSDVYVLMGGAGDVTALAGLLNDAGLGGCMITVAADLSFPDEKIITDSAERYAAGTVLEGLKSEKNLYICHIYNPAPLERAVAAGLRPDEFIRGKVPMTKEEVRTVTIDKLRLKPESRVLDIGCGTGSMTVEIVGLIPDGMVFAYDDNDEAVSLTKANVFKHKLPNVIVTKGTAPEVFREGESFPNGISNVFIGGNKGRLRDILDLIKHKSTGTGVRVVLNVIRDKTAEALRSWIADNEVSDYDVVKIGVSRGDEMTAENEVFIYSFMIPGSDSGITI